MNEVDDLKAKLASLERQLEEARAINRNNPSCMMPDGADPCDAYPKLRETQVKLLALHEALEKFGKCTDDCFNVRRDGPCDCGLAAAVFGTSATASQRVEAIRREAVDKALAKLTKGDFRVQQWSEKMGCGWVSLTAETALATLLGEKEKK